MNSLRAMGDSLLQRVVPRATASACGCPTGYSTCRRICRSGIGVEVWCQDNKISHPACRFYRTCPPSAAC